MGIMWGVGRGLLRCSEVICSCIWGGSLVSIQKPSLVRWKRNILHGSTLEDLSGNSLPFIILGYSGSFFFSHFGKSLCWNPAYGSPALLVFSSHLRERLGNSA